ncbi:MAG TPA: DUF3160 domain-containing protein [Actinobacteria bacterium]|nr:DUF3160 domain-containing protein [Actinomycetota bacterium]
MRTFTAAIVIALLVAACTGGSEAPTTPAAVATSTSTPHPWTTSTTSGTTASTTTASTTTTSTGPVADMTLTVEQQPRSLSPFAAYTLVPLDEQGTYPGPAWPTSLDSVVISPEAEYLVGRPEVARALTDDGFVVVPGYAALFQDVYAQAPYDNHAIFVTTDAGYHVLHLAFGKVLRDTEQNFLLPALDDLVIRSVAAARGQAAAFEGTGLAAQTSRVAQLFEAAAVLLGLDVGPVGPLAGQEVGLATEAARMTTSPITGFTACNPAQSPRGCVDYTLFKPRGHYTRNEDLERYFRAMSLLGQEGASFVVEMDGETPVVDEPSMQFALLVASAMQADPVIEQDWRLIYEPTAFMVGMADDYTPFELAAVAASVVGDGWSTDDLANTGLLRTVAEELLATRPVGINPEAASVRIMGARFVIDSYILDQLAWPNVGEEPPAKRRVYVSPLDVAATFDSDLALGIQRQAGEDRYLHYEDRMAAMRELISVRTEDDWAATVYDAWMSALQPVWREHGDAFPPFMRNDAWTAKDLQTGLGSYAELKHDTILYAKQEFAAEGGGDWTELHPRHWVEPDPIAFERMSQVAALLQSGLTGRGLLTDADDRLLGDLREFLARLARLAGDELSGRAISTDDNDWLGRIGSAMEGLWYASSDADPETGAVASGDARDALIADIGRTTFKYLEIGTGAIDQILVLVPDDTGRFQVAIGGVYSYYEFWRPKELGRLTDEEWWKLLDDGAAPDRLAPMILPNPDGGERHRPAWQAAFLVP